MKIRKYLALLLVVLMTTTVVSAAEVLTAPKAAAVDGTTTYQSITYVPDGTYTYGPTQFNYHAVYDYSGIFGPSTHTEVSSGGRVTAMLRTATFQNGLNYAEAGEQWMLTNYADNADKPVKVTMKMSYTLAVRGDHDSVAGMSIGSSGDLGRISPYVDDHVYGDNPVLVKTVTQTFTWTGDVDEFFYEDGSGYWKAGVYAHDSSNIPARVTATGYVQSITIEFPIETS